MRSTILGVIVISALLVLYIVVVGWRAVMLIQTDNLAAVIMGVALIVLPLIGIWALVRELVFGVQSAQLMKRLAEQGRMPDDDFPRLPSGRVDRRAAEPFFPKYQAETEAAPGEWQSWLRLGLIYDACGDRRRARQAVNTAIRLSRA